MRPLPFIESEARAKGGRASGGTRYYSAKTRGEDKMIRLMQKALDEKKSGKTKQPSLKDLTVDELISLLNSSCANTEKLLQEAKNVFRRRSSRVY